MVEEPPLEPQHTTLFARDWGVPWHAHILPAGLALLMLAIWIFAGDQVAVAWALSRQSIESGLILTLILHMFAHGGLLHVLMNVAALLLLSGPLISRLGRPPLSWARYSYLFIGSGLSGAAAFLLLNRDSSISVLGASGAIFGLVAALARVNPTTGNAVDLRSQRTWLLVKFFIQNHLSLFVFLAIMALASGRWVGLAWEAHLGGLLFGFFATPFYLIRDARK